MSARIYRNVSGKWFGQIDGKTVREFANGEVAYLWYQNNRTEQPGGLFDVDAASIDDRITRALVAQDRVQTIAQAISKSKAVMS